MATITNVIKWVSNKEEFRQEIQQSTNQLVAMQSAVEKTVRSLSGEGLLRAANNAAAAVQQLGGVAKLTAAEKERLNTLLGKAIEKYQALGQTAPSAIMAIEAETRKLSPANEQAGLTLGKLAASYVTAQLALDLFKGGLRAVIGFLRDSIDAYGEAEAAQKKLTAALSAQGNATPAVIDQYNQLAGQFQRTTVFSDDMINEMEALFVQIGDVGPKQMERALSSATNLAAGLGIDLESATRMVAKALEGNMQSLQRYGIQIDKTALATRGADAVFEAIQSRFGGQAVAQADTYTGRVQMMGNAWNNFQEAVGKALVDDPSVREFLRTATDLMNAVSGSTDQATTSVGALMQKWREFQELVNPGLKLKREQDELNDLINTTNEQVTALVAKLNETRGPMADMASGQAGVAEQVRETWIRAQEALAKYEKETAEAKKRAEEYARAVQNMRDQFSGSKLLGDLKKLEDAWRSSTKEVRNSEAAQKDLMKALDPIVQRFGPGVLPKSLADVRSQYFQLNVVGIDVNRMIADQTAKTKDLLTEKGRLIALARTEAATMKALPLQETAFTYQQMGETMQFVADQQARLNQETEDYKRKLDEARAKAFDPWIAGLDGAAAAVGRFSQTGAQAIGVVSQLTKSVETLGMETATTSEKVSAGASGILAMIALYQMLDKVISEAQHRRDTFEARRQIQENLDLTISPGLASAFATEGLTRYRDQLRQLPRIVADVGGVTVFNLAKIQKAVLDMFGTMTDAYRRNVISLEVMARNMDEVFPQLAAVATRDGALVSKAFLDIITQEEKLGLQTQAVTKFLRDQISVGVGGLAGFLQVGADAYQELKKAQDALLKPGANVEELTKQIEEQQKIIAAAGIKTQQAAEAFGAAIAAGFAKLLERGVSIADALKELEPAVTALQTQLSATGLSGGAAFTEIQGFIALMKDEIAGPALSAIGSLNTAFVGLANSGLLNQDIFAGLSGQVSDTFNALVAQGKNGDEVLRLIQPTLQTIWELEQQFGFSVDDATQKLIDQGVEAGIVGEKFRSPQEKMALAAERTATAVEAIARALGALPSAASNAAAGIESAVRRLPDRIEIPVDFPTRGIPTPAPAEPEVPEMAARGGLVSSAGRILQFAQGGMVPVQRFDLGGAVAKIIDFTPKGTDVQPALLTPGEVVLNAAQQRNLAGALSSHTIVNQRFAITVDMNGAVVDSPERADELAEKITTKLARKLARDEEFCDELGKSVTANRGDLRTKVRGVAA